MNFDASRSKVRIDEEEVAMRDTMQSVRLRGTGTFSAGTCVITAGFDVVHHPWETVFAITVDSGCHPFLFSNTPWSLRGVLNDGRCITCAELMRTSTKAQFTTAQSVTKLIPNDCVIIGDIRDQPVARAEFPLVGMFSGIFEFKEGKWTVAVLNEGDTVKQAVEASQLHKMPMEGQLLRISNPIAGSREYEEEALSIITLLSLALGTGVTFNKRLLFFDGSATPCEIWRRRVDHEIGPGACVPDHALADFLKHTLSRWGKWSHDKKQIVRMAITYVNCSNAGYLDTRLFTMTQAWEFLSRAWCRKRKLSAEEKSLKAELKSVYETWGSANGNTHPDYELWERISFAFEWKRLLDQLNAFASSRGLKVDKIGLDFRALKEARDSTAHTGKMPSALSKDKSFAMRLLRSAQRGLQYLLLRELGYTGDVVGEKAGGKTFAPISDFFDDVNSEEN